MPYTDAVIHEVQRFADIAPAIFHANKDEYQFECYTIPKVFSVVCCFWQFLSWRTRKLFQNSAVMGYVGGIHRSKKYWAKPYEFYPEHFLDDNGLLRKNVEGYLPFSTGKIVLLLFLPIKDIYYSTL